jgi:hypothetical protein
MNWKETVLASSKHSPGIFSERQRKPTGNLRIEGIQTDIQSQHLPD